jgi:cytoskeleton protein RodZ
MSEPQPGTETAGGLLRAAREKQGLHIAALAAAIKVSQRKLEALEANRYDELPDATFTRALAQTVCRTLKVDARPVLELLPPAPSVALEPGSGSLNTPFRDRPAREEPGLAVAAKRPMVWAAAALVLAAVAVMLAPADWWQQLRGATAPAVALPASAPAAEAASLPATAGSAAQAAAESASAAASQPMVETVFAAQNPEPAASAAPATPVQAAAPNTPVAPAPVATAAHAAPSGLVQLRSSEASWIEVRDARGVLLLSRTVQPGESVGLDGSLPIRLVIGNAAATQLGFRGQPVDLASSTRDNVARVELR